MSIECCHFICSEWNARAPFCVLAKCEILANSGCYIWHMTLQPHPFSFKQNAHAHTYAVFFLHALLFIVVFLFFAASKSSFNNKTNTKNPFFFLSASQWNC